MKIEPLVSIIILNLNKKEILKDCLETLKEQSYKNFEIILVDNGSTDDSVSFVKENFPEVKIIANKRNLGFAAGNNQGLKIAGGKYIVTLNNDTQVEKSWLKNLVVTSETDEKIGMCASKILSIKNPEQIDSVGINICIDGMTRGRGRLEINDGQYEKTEEVLLPSACAALYKREMLDEIGFFDEDFFAYCEDSDLGLRGRFAGWKAFLAPEAVVYHYYSLTSKKYSSLKAFLVERNHVLLAVKFFPPELLLFFPFLTLYRFALQFYAAIIKKGATSEFLSQYSFLDTAAIIFKAYFDALKKMPLFIKKRIIIQKSKKMSRAEFYSWLKKYKLTFKEVVFKK